ncbi:LysM domain receptor-like kinase 3 [Tanacetum coccineum]
MLMASSTHFIYITLFITSFTLVFPLDVVIKSTVIYPLSCSNYTRTCGSYLYHISKGHKLEDIASFYSVNTSKITPITHNTNLDYLVSVQCACGKDNNSNAYYYYDSVYKRKPGESVEFIKDEYYSGQVWNVSEKNDEQVNVRIVCGCVENEFQEVVTYTIQAEDTLIGISRLLNAKEVEVENMNKALTKDPNYMDIGWVLFVPKEKNMIRASKKAATNIESEKPVIISLEEIEQATNNFDEARKIGEGGYGSVYFGIIREREAAIKKMRSSKSKEFFAELKVQLLGYASGDDHLYLVYEYVQNGTLSEHLRDPLLKGHQPLSWSARANIALDAARGIEYIHDHTKARYVHRDIKTTNILLDLGLKAKVADFGLTKFVERANEDDFIATRVVGTPGYLAPESISEMQTTSKTDVFAFGVVLAELITGQPALARDKKEPNKFKTLISVIRAIFQDQDPTTALEAQVDNNIKDSYPIDEMYKMAETAFRCLSEDPASRPEMSNVVTMLGQVVMSSIEWEASLGGTSQVFSGVFNGR